MSTIGDKPFINELIAGDGYYEGDPRVAQIVEYENAWGNITWGVTWCNESAKSQKRYEIPTEYIHDPKVIWKCQTQ